MISTVSTSVYVMGISSMTLILDMIVYLINGEGIFPYVGNDVKKYRFIYGILAIIAIVGAIVLCVTRSSR